MDKQAALPSLLGKLLKPKNLAIAGLGAGGLGAGIYGGKKLYDVGKRTAGNIDRMNQFIEGFGGSVPAGDMRDLGRRTAGSLGQANQFVEGFGKAMPAGGASELGRQASQTIGRANELTQNPLGSLLKGIGGSASGAWNQFRGSSAFAPTISSLLGGLGVGGLHYLLSGKDRSMGSSLLPALLGAAIAGGGSYMMGPGRKYMPQSLGQLGGLFRGQ